MFNFANPAAARRWDEAHAKAEAKREEPEDAVGRATAAVSNVVDFMRRSVAPEPQQPRPKQAYVATTKSSRSEAEEPVGGGSDEPGGSPPLSVVSRRSAATPSTIVGGDTPVASLSDASANASSSQTDVLADRRLQPVEAHKGGALVPQPPSAEALSGSQMERDCSFFTPHVGRKLADLAVLTLRVGGVKRLHVAADYTLHAGPSGFQPKPNLKPYVTAHLAGRDGRKLESEGFSFGSGPHKPELSASESAPVWDEEFDFELSEVMVTSADSMVLTVLDSSGRGWFGSSADDVALCQASARDFARVPHFSPAAHQPPPNAHPAPN